jgi:hypothetical protein
MKKAIWVLENIKESNDFYDELTIVMLIASICSWKRHNITFDELHCDSKTLEKLKEFNILHLWDNVDTSIVDSISSINKTIFWASSKVRVLLAQTECVSLVDTDFISYAPIYTIGAEYPVIYSHDEDGLQWYCGVEDPYIKKIKGLPSWLIHTPNQSALNVCYLSFNDIKLQQEYAKYSVKAMEELSLYNVPDGVHMVWAEQKILKQIIINKQIECKTLIKNIFSCESKNFKEDLFNYSGEWTYTESLSKYYHIGFDKKDLRNENSDLKFLYIICKDYVDEESIKLILNK